jgi:Zn-dependent peptidase ImmA (M78 family)
MKIFKEDFDVEVNSDVAKWIVKISGFTLEELSNKTKIKKDRLEMWINGKVKLKFSEIDKISKIIKKPLTVFILPYPPKEKKLPENWRTVNLEKEKFHPKTISLLYKTREIQELTKELAKNINYDLTPKIEFIENISNISAKELGRKYREDFGLTKELQLKFENPKELFQFLKNKIEERNILILQLPIPTKDARGFVLTDNLPFTIVVSTEDDLRARNFTLIHELAHLMLKISVIDSPLDSLYFPLSERKKWEKEKWCNDFASEFLFPEEFLQEKCEKYHEKITKFKILEDISKEYKVSKEMIIYKLEKLNRISPDIYKKYKEKFEKQKEIFYRIKQPPSHLEIKINQLGKLFISVVVRNERTGKITYSDALDYLSVKSKVYEKLATNM